MQEGSMTGFAERNSKWDVEYEGKDAVGTLVRPFEPGWGDSRSLPGKMLGETTSQAVARSMGRNMPHSGAGDGKKVFRTKNDPSRLAAMVKEEAEKDGVGRHFSKAGMSPEQRRSARHLAKMERKYPGSPVMKGVGPRLEPSTLAFICGPGLFDLPLLPRAPLPNPFPRPSTRIYRPRPPSPPATPGCV
jgi:hypothetical protein